jgi:hypothetical protein
MNTELAAVEYKSERQRSRRSRPDIDLAHRRNTIAKGRRNTEHDHGIVEKLAISSRSG